MDNNISELKSENKKMLDEINNMNQKIIYLKKKINQNIKIIQNDCKHEWITETQVCERIVSCINCKMINWDKSRT